MAIVSATETELDTFLDKYGFAVADDKSILLARSFVFLSTLKFCIEPPTDIVIEAQGFLVNAISNGGVDLFGAAEDKVLTKKGLGRSAIVKEWEINSLTSGSDNLSRLNKIPMVQNLLAPYLCVNQPKYSAGMVV